MNHIHAPPPPPPTTTSSSGEGCFASFMDFTTDFQNQINMVTHRMEQSRVATDSSNFQFTAGDDISIIDRIDISLDDIVSKEMNRMTLEERELVYEQIHGVEKDVEETEDMICNALQEMHQKVQEIPNKKAYDLALSMNRQYVHDRKVLLRFLRADGFDSKKAAIRFVLFLEKKRELFGESLLTRSITLNDLSEEDLTILKSNEMIRFLPCCDSAGRSIIMNQSVFDLTDSALRAVTYLLCSIVESDEACQKRGFVGIAHYASLPKFDVKNFAKMQPLLACLPIRFKSVHSCISTNPIVRALTPMMLMAVSRDFRSRLRIHEGSVTEIKYSLMTYGIPVKELQLESCDEGGNGKMKPSSLSGNFIVQQRHKEWFEQQYGTGTFRGIRFPKHADVLVGRGKPFRDYYGHLRLRRIVEGFLEEHRCAAFGEKSAIASKVIALVKPGRFLRKNEHDWWEEVGDAAAREVVMKAFRSARKSQPSMATTTTSTSGVMKQQQHKKQQQQQRQQQQYCGEENGGKRFKINH